MAMYEGQQRGGYNSGYSSGFNPYEDRRPYERFGYGFNYGYPYEPYGFESQTDFPRGEHTWRGGVLGWLGAGIRAGAGWFGDQLQNWGNWFGGRVRGGTAEVGRAVRGRGEQMASALEDQDQRSAMARQSQSPRYRRPDERVLDDVWHRISVAAVDPQDVEIEVSEGVVTLSGRVSTRFEKRIIEDIADGVFGVKEVHNHLRLARMASEGRPTGTETDPLKANTNASSSQKSFENIGQPERH